MKLSVIIVNYNVRAYLEQCLTTVEAALKGLDGDVFVLINLHALQRVRKRQTPPTARAMSGLTA